MALNVSHFNESKTEIMIFRPKRSSQGHLHRSGLSSLLEKRVHWGSIYEA